MIGEFIGNYRLVRLLGEGGMGMVYEAIHEGVGGRAAIKVLRPEIASQKEITARFFNEARAANSISHPGIIHIFDSGYTTNGIAYLTMEFLEGESLKSRIERVRVLTVLETLRVGHQVASALAAAHRKQVIHRDLKPDNLMLVKDPDVPGGERVKILDFGIAKIVETLSSQPVRTRSDMLMGTPTYMAPEQCQGAKSVTDRSDVYSMGVMLYQLLAGSPPFVSERVVGLLALHVSEEPPPLLQRLPQLDPNVAVLVHSMLRKPPDERPSMEEVFRSILRLLNSIANSPTQPPRPSSPSLSGNVAVPSLLDRSAVASSALPPAERQTVQGRQAVTTPTIRAEQPPAAQASRTDATASGDQRPTQPLSLINVQHFAQRAEAPPVTAGTTESSQAMATGISDEPPAASKLVRLEPLRTAVSEAPTAQRQAITPDMLPRPAHAEGAAQQQNTLLATTNPQNQTLAVHNSNKRTVAGGPANKQTLVGFNSAFYWRRLLHRNRRRLPAVALLVAAILMVIWWLLNRAPPGRVTSAADTAGNPARISTGVERSSGSGLPTDTPYGQQAGSRTAEHSTQEPSEPTLGMPLSQSPGTPDLAPGQDGPGSVSPPKPPPLDPLIEKAYRAWKKARYEEAIKLSTECTDAKPEYYQCWWVLGLSACNIPRYELIEKAVNHLQLRSINRENLAQEVVAECRALGLQRNRDGTFSRPPLQSEILVMIKKANDYFQQQRYAEAMAIAEDYANYEPLSLWAIVGKCACALKIPERAEQAMERYQDGSMRNQVIAFCRQNGFDYDYRLGRLKRR
ncbi:MAG: protein kinase [Myxococcales bacterium]|nr:protein kinase [Myxococcales bacterium]